MLLDSSLVVELPFLVGIIVKSIGEGEIRLGTLANMKLNVAFIRDPNN